MPYLGTVCDENIAFETGMLSLFTLTHTLVLDSGSYSFIRSFSKKKKKSTMDLFIP